MKENNLKKALEIAKKFHNKPRTNSHTQYCPHCGWPLVKLNIEYKGTDLEYHKFKNTVFTCSHCDSSIIYDINGDGRVNNLFNERNIKYCQFKFLPSINWYCNSITGELKDELLDYFEVSETKIVFSYGDPLLLDKEFTMYWFYDIEFTPWYEPEIKTKYLRLKFNTKEIVLWPKLNLYPQCSQSFKNRYYDYKNGDIDLKHLFDNYPKSKIFKYWTIICHPWLYFRSLFKK